MTDERKKQLAEQVGMPNSHSIKSLIEQVENETKQQLVSDGYLQRVNTQMLVNDLRTAIDRALLEKMQFATVVGVLQFLITEMIEVAQEQEG